MGSGEETGASQPHLSTCLSVSLSQRLVERRVSKSCRLNDSFSVDAGQIWKFEVNKA